MTAFTHRLSRIARREPYPAQKIRAPINGLEMRGVDTGAHSAEMVKIESCRNRPDKQLIKKAMGAVPFLLVADHTVTIVTNMTRPQPATRIRFGLHVFEHAVKRVGFVSHWTLSLSRYTGK